MADNETTTKFKVDISELKSGIQEANRQIRLANAEFKAASSGMDNWAKSADGVSAKIKQLETVLQSENTKLSSLKKQLELVEKEQGKNSKGADELRIAIANQQAAVNKTERSLNGYKSELDNLENELDDVSEASKDAEKNTKSLGDGFSVLKGAAASLIADGIKNIASSLVSLVSDTREYRNEMSKLETAFTTNGHSVESAKGAYEELYGILGDEGQAVEASNFLAKLTDNEKDLAEWTNICAGVYGQFGSSLPIEGLTEAANETAKVGQVTGPLADALNWTTMSAEQWNNVLSNNPKAMSAFNKGIKEGMNTEDAFNEALAKCTTEQERQQLIMGSLTAMYGDSATAFKETNSATIEANKAQSALTDSMAQLGAAAEPVVTSVKQGFADLLSKALELIDGADFSAVAENISQGFDSVINNVLPAVKEGFQWILDNKDGLIAGLGGIAAGFVAFNVVSIIQGVVASFQAFKAAQEGATVAQWLLNAAMSANPVGLVIAAITGLVAAFVVLWNKSEAFRNFWIGLWEGIKNAFSAVVNWIKENWQTMLTFLQNPLAGVFKYCYEHFEGFRNTVDSVVSAVKNFFTKLWENIKTGCSNAVTWIKNKWNDAVSAVQQKVSSWKSFFSNIWNNIKSVFSSVASWFGDIFSSAWSAVQSAWNAAVSFFSGIWNSITSVFSAVGSWFGSKFTEAWNAIKSAWGSVTSFFSDIWNKIKSVFKIDDMLNVGKNIVEGLWNGINDKVEWLKGKIKSFVGNVTEWIKKFFGINSPAKTMIPIGEAIDEGIVVGMEKANGLLENQAEKTAEEVQDMFRNTLIPEAKSIGEEVTEELANGMVIGGKHLEGVISDLKESLGEEKITEWFKYFTEEQKDDILRKFISEIPNAKTTEDVQTLLSKYGSEYSKAEHLTEDGNFIIPATDGFNTYNTFLRIWKYASYAMYKDAEEAGAKMINLSESVLDEIMKINFDAQSEYQIFAQITNEEDFKAWTRYYAQKLLMAKTYEERQEVINDRAREMELRGISNFSYALDLARKEADVILNAFATDADTYFTAVSDSATTASENVEKAIRISVDRISDQIDVLEEQRDELLDAMSSFRSATRGAFELMSEETKTILNVPGYHIPKGGITQAVPTLTNLNAIRENVKTRNEQFLAIKDLIPKELYKELIEMSPEESGTFINAFMKLTPEQQKQYVADYVALMDEIAKSATPIFEDDIEPFNSEISDLADNVTTEFSTLPEELLNIGGSAAEQFATGFMAEINALIENVKSTIMTGLSELKFNAGGNDSTIIASAIPQAANGGVLKRGQMAFLEGKGAEAIVPLENNAGWIRKTAADLKRQLANDGLFSTANNSVVNNYNFTQNNNSPKALSRLEIYRQTKNQLNFAKGV